MDDWHIDALDLDAYLARIGQPKLPPSAAALRALTEAHVLAIPFENLDVLLGTHGGLGIEAIQAKLVHAKRGGYCYEHALLFAAVAERLGYPVRRRISRIRPQFAGFRTHMMLIITVAGEDQVVDVGYGAGMWRPMPLRDGAEVDQAGWPHRLTLEGPQWTLWKRQDGDWVAQHAFTDTETRPSDYELAHHYTSTSPHSPFTKQVVVMRLAEGISRRLVGGELTVERASGETTTTHVPPERLGATLCDLDVEPTQAQLARLLEVTGSPT